DRRNPRGRDPDRPQTSGDSGVPPDQGATRLRCRAPGTREPPGEARLPGARRHPDHAARRGPPADRV
ncbi:MAG: FIG002473: Protein YcaR in KDO2-Lipid A biosynthesis cluster, partial [uncultured Microvirga sp.]